MDTAGWVAQRNAQGLLIVDEFDIRVDMGTHLKRVDDDEALCGYRWEGNWASHWYDPGMDGRRCRETLCAACVEAAGGMEDDVCVACEAGQDACDLRYTDAGLLCVWCCDEMGVA